MVSKNPLLTVAIPAYNVADFLSEAVWSLSPDKFDNELEVLIVNDGSTDKTREIAESLAENFPNVSVVNKRNGGHGSTINTAIELASGKYFKLLDGDDWFETAVFKKFMTRLKQEDADLILCEHVEVFQKTGKRKVTSFYKEFEKNKIFDTDVVVFREFGVLLPNTTIKTSLLKKAGFRFDENCYYVDQEYNLICYVEAKTVAFYDCPIYQYRLEREGQSMERSGLVKNVVSHEKVCLRLIREFEKRVEVLPKNKISYLREKMIIPLCHLQYTITINYSRSRSLFLSFDKKLAAYPDFYNDPGIAGTILKLHRKTRGLTVLFDTVLKRLGEKIN